MNIILKVFVGIAAVIYPIAVFFGLQYFEPKYIALLLAAIIAFRLLPDTSGSKLMKKNQLVIISLVGFIIVVFTWFSNSSSGLKLYPVALNILLFFIFAASLRYPPTIIERFARIQQPQLPQSGISYTRKVTQVWCVFFIVNGVIAFYTAMYASMEQWTLYNGLISYIAMGCLMIGELAFRKFVLKK